MGFFKALSLGLFLSTGVAAFAGSAGCDQWLRSEWAPNLEFFEILSHALQVGGAPLDQVQSIRPGISFSVVASREAFTEHSKIPELPPSLMKAIGRTGQSGEDFMTISGGVNAQLKISTMERAIDEIVGPRDQTLLEDFKRTVQEIFTRFARKGTDLLFVSGKGSTAPLLVMLFPDYRSAGKPEVASFAIVLSFKAD